MTAVRLALFDFDATVSPSDSILPYLLWCIRVKAAPKTQLLKAAAGYLRMHLRGGSVTRSKEVCLSFLTGKPQEEVNALARRFWQEKLVPGLFASAVETLHRLKQEGYTIVFVSASPSCYMDVLTEYLPADAVLCTRCTQTSDGRHAGPVEDNCRAENKVARVRAWLKENALEADWKASCAYGDSHSDAPMLRLVGHPVLVNPKKALKQALPEAERVHWE